MNESTVDIAQGMVAAFTAMSQAVTEGEMAAAAEAAFARAFEGHMPDEIIVGLTRFCLAMFVDHFEHSVDTKEEILQRVALRVVGSGQ